LYRLSMHGHMSSLKLETTVSGFSRPWGRYPVVLKIDAEPVFGNLHGRVEPELKVRIREQRESGCGRPQPCGLRFSEDGKCLEIRWDSRGNGSRYSVEIHDSHRGGQQGSSVGFGTGDAMRHGIPEFIGDLHLGLISRPQAFTDELGRDNLLCTTTGFQGGMFLCRRLQAAPSLLFDAPRRIFLPYLTADTVDWDGDGRTDLVCAQGGRVLFVQNAGTNKDPVFEERDYLRTESSVLQVPNMASVEVVDWEGDGLKDLLVGVNDSSEYWPGGENPWQNKECGVGYGKGYSRTGRWLGGREHSSIMLCRNVGTPDKPVFAEPVYLPAGRSKVDLRGGGKLGAGDLDGDGDVDVVFGEHLDRIAYLENVGRPGKPRLKKAVYLRQLDGSLLLNPQCMTEPIVHDLDGDGVPDLVFGSEDGYVYFCKNQKPGVRPPVFSSPRTLKQRNPCLGTGVAAVPSAVDWDEDGDLDLIVGCAAGYVEFFENVGTRRRPRFKQAVRLEAAGETIRIQAGRRGSIQGPNEAKWGYTCPVVADWDGDGRQDILLSDVKGEHLFYRNVGRKGRPVLDRPRPLRVGGRELRTVWRTRPIAEDLDGDGLVDYACLDKEGYLTVHWRRRRKGRLILENGVRPKYVDGSEIKLDSVGGKVGRTQLCAADWDGDGDWDILFGAHEATPLLHPYVHTSVLFLENVGSRDKPVFKRPVFVRTQGAEPIDLGHHCCSPHAVDWDGDGELDLIVGAENGNIYYFHRSFLCDQGRVEVLNPEALVRG